MRGVTQDDELITFRDELIELGVPRFILILIGSFPEFLLKLPETFLISMNELKFSSFPPYILHFLEMSAHPSVSSGQSWKAQAQHLFPVVQSFVSKLWHSDFRLMHVSKLDLQKRFSGLR